jgi:hypothetical protein
VSARKKSPRGIHVLVCGGRDFTDRKLVFAVIAMIHNGFKIARIIEGGARGVDTFARAWAGLRDIERETFHADWSRGLAAGPYRNAKMLREGAPDLGVAFPGGRGTADMVRRMVDTKLPRIVVGRGGNYEMFLTDRLLRYLKSP